MNEKLGFFVAGTRVQEIWQQKFKDYSDVIFFCT